MRQRKNYLTLPDLPIWRTHSCVPRRYSCRRPPSQGAEVSSGDSTLHAGVRAPRLQLPGYSCVAPMRAIIATLLSGLLVVSAQTPPPAAPKGVVKFGATTQLVVVDVTVKDKSGNPIKGLKPADFNITEDGKKQDIKIFTYQELEETVTPEPVPAKAPTPAPAPAPKAPDAPAVPVAPVVKAVTANQIAPSRPGEVKYKDRRLLVMFFDMTSMPIQDQIRAQTAAQKFLKTQMTTSDLM